ncbi:carbamoyl-phosphate synthase small subunit [Candidatus Magnetoovum chiemensis]|nr:carbamoyl-phosphate synthase small subunit [Candidatus Magnetoovum chiemensis]
MSSKKAYLVLKDGTVFDGRPLGFLGEAIGEVVFNTSMSGYQEILTDPSYKGQIVTMTYTQIGNYGVNDEDTESNINGPCAEGFIVKEACPYPSNWRSKYSIDAYLDKFGITGIQSIDTRALTTHLRTHGAQMGIISSTAKDPKELYLRIKDHPGIDGIDLVKYVTANNSYQWSDGFLPVQSQDSTNTKERKHIVVYDFGVKFNILRCLKETGFDVTVVPAATPYEAVLDMNPDGILLSNGPGDPQVLSYAIKNVKKLIGKKPIFGICLGHQIIGLALGAKAYKLKFGHHGANHPVIDIETEAIKITSQNHNYCVDIKSIEQQVTLTHRNLYDNTEEGMKHIDMPLFSVQYHPEASPGPHESFYLFQRFKDMIERF